MITGINRYIVYEQIVIRLSNFELFLRFLLSKYLNPAKSYQMRACVSHGLEREKEEHETEKNEGELYEIGS